MNRFLLLAAATACLGPAALSQSLIALNSNRQMSRVNKLTGATTHFATCSSIVGTAGGLAHDFATDTLYLTSTDNDSLYTIDVNTGQTTLVGAYGDSTIVMHGLEFDISTGTLYGCSGATNRNLYSINTTTGVATLIGPTGLAGSGFINLCHDVSTNTMFATYTSDDSLYTIDRTSGAMTLIGLLNGPTNPHGLAYEIATDTIWLVCSATDILYTVNKVTGATTAIGPLGAGNWLGVVMMPPTGTYEIFGAGCAGALGVPGNVPLATANVGSTMSINLTNLPHDAAVFMLGFSNTVSPAFGPLPIDLTLVGAPGCFGRIDPQITGFILGAAGTATFNIGIPDDPALFVGLQLYTQGLVFDVTIPFGFTTSDAAVGVIGL